MRGVGALFSLVAASLIALPAVAGENDGGQAEAGKVKEQPDDYYSRRAKNVLAAEKAAQIKPHPLAPSYPGLDIVVCEAGCQGRTPAVVYAQPQSITQSESLMVPTAGNVGEPAQDGKIACVAGCYDERASEPVRAALPSYPATERPLSHTLPERDKLSPIR